MPAKTIKRDGRHRVVHGPNNALVKNPHTNTPVDGGGHQTASQAQKQAQAINRSKT